MKRIVFLIFILTFFNSCYTSQEVNKAMSSFNGKHYSTLINMGAPAQVVDDGSGGRYLRYVEVSTTTVNGYSTTNTTINSTTTAHGYATIYDDYIWGNASSNTYTTATTNTTYTPSQTYTTTYWIQFHIDSKGIINQVQWYLPYLELQNFTRQYYITTGEQRLRKQPQFYKPQHSYNNTPSENNTKQVTRVQAKQITQEEIKKKNLTVDQCINNGVAEYESMNYSNAIEYFNYAIELNPNSWIAYYNRGLAKYDNKDIEGAKLDWKKSTELKS
ncbi:MAG: hypothetical protein WCQ95_01405 [Bacteroidota bacterium]